MELLAPAGYLEKAKIALLYGADAVYVGGKSFSLRARASNFTIDDLEELANFAHGLNKKVYVTMNIVPHDDDLNGLKEYLIDMNRIGIDAIITTSRFIMTEAKKYAPNVEVHVSTQNSITNLKQIEYYKSLGATRCVLAREVNMIELEYLAKNSPLELEVFIHGGMCASYSGRCVLSNYMTNRDANRGGCAHSCRWNYTLKKNSQKVNENGYFSMGSKDLQALRFIPRLIDLNVASFKIEGRMKSTYYLATVVKCYREIIDLYQKQGYLTEENYMYFEKEIRKAENRLTSVGFYKGLPSIEEQLYDNRSEHPTKEYVGVVLSYDEESKIAVIEQRNYFEKGNTLEFFGPNLDNTLMVCPEFYDYNTKEELNIARHPLQKLTMKVDFPVKKDDMVRLVKNDEN